MIPLPDSPFVALVHKAEIVGAVSIRGLERLEDPITLQLEAGLPSDGAYRLVGYNATTGSDSCSLILYLHEDDDQKDEALVGLLTDLYRARIAPAPEFTTH